MNVTGTLSIVATPIGNLEDMTYRAVRTLQEVDEILCEDTRTSSILLKHYAIQTPTQSFHAHTSPAKKEAIIQKLLRGSNLALISDAGTPGISDPGFVLIEAAIAAGITVVPIPGASAIITALCASGLDTHQFSYLGFAPLKKGRMTLFREIAESPYTSVLYESVHRLEKTLSQLQEACGNSREIVIGRELTKKFETFFRGNLESACLWAKEPTTKGEFVLCIGAQYRNGN